MKAHIHEVDLTNVTRLFEVRVFEKDSDAKKCMKTEAVYQGCKSIRIFDNGSAYVSMTLGKTDFDVMRQVRDFLMQQGVNLILWRAGGRIRKYKRRKGHQFE